MFVGVVGARVEDVAQPVWGVSFQGGSPRVLSCHPEEMAAEETEHS